MTIEQKEFRRYNTEEERENFTFTLRLSKEESDWVFKCMEIMDLKSKGTAIKALAEIGKNVLLTTYPLNLKYLFKKDRVRLSDLSAKEIRNIRNCVTKD